METFTPDTDAGLINSLKNSDHRAFERLFKKYGRKLFVFAMAYLKDEEDSREVVQEVFLKVWLNRVNLKTDTSFQSYLFTIAFNSIRKSFNRKAKNDQYKLSLIDELKEDQEQTEFESNYQLIEKKLEQFIEEMPEKRKAIFIQRKKMGKPVRQIAEEMGLSVKTIENQITESMKFLKRRFEEELPDSMLFLLLIRYLL